ncbi:MAG: glycosyltransferase family 39 protein [Candidatus Pacebacteria bacterium]|nr:glycosyltransferase family 39 protein [Candidatus Paceibacterota bacterium]
MVSLIKKLLDKDLLIIIAMWLLIMIGVALRAHKGDTFPISNNDDGLIYTWAGTGQYNNLTNFASLTIFDEGNEYLLWRSQYKNFIPHQEFGMKITRPWFDHPPLGVLLIGTIPHFLGYDNIEQIPHMVIRFSAILASVFTMWFTFELAKKLFNQKVAFLSLIFLATIPYFVFAQRQAYLENYLNPVFLGSLLLLLKYLEKKKTKYFIGSLILALLMGWMKIVGFAIPFMLAVWLMKKKDFKHAFIMIGTNIASIIGYGIYGFTINKDAFLQLISNQGERGAFMSSFFKAMTKIEIYQLFDSGWYVLGLVMAIVIMLGLTSHKKKTEGEEIYSWFFLAWLIVLFILSGKFNNSPWYRYPLIPFMSISIGYFVNTVLKTKDMFRAGVLFLLGLTGMDLIGLEVNSTLVRLATVGFFGVLVLDYIFKHDLTKKLSGVMIKLFVASLILLNVLVVLKYYSASYCNENLHCLTPTKVILKD